MQSSLKNTLLWLGFLSLCFVAIPLKVSVNDPIELEFQKFILLHKKPYIKNSTEYEQRLENFKVCHKMKHKFCQFVINISISLQASHLRSMHYNKVLGAHSKMNFGITKFSDLKPEEFEELLLRHQPSAEPCIKNPLRKNKLKRKNSPLKKREISFENKVLPDYIDW